MDELVAKPCWNMMRVDVGAIASTPNGGIYVAYRHPKDGVIFTKYTFKLRYASHGKHPKDRIDSGGFDSSKSAKRSVVWDCRAYESGCKPDYTGPGQR
jgi:hypothetical protein